MLLKKSHSRGHSTPTVESNVYVELQSSRIDCSSTPYDGKTAIAHRDVGTAMLYVVAYAMQSGGTVSESVVR